MHRLSTAVASRGCRPAGRNCRRQACRDHRSEQPAGLVVLQRPALRWSMLLAAVLVVVTGCQRIEEVTGTLRIDGKPARGIRVTFTAVNGDGPRGLATTDKDGAFTLHRLGPGGKTGVPTGAYNVTLMPNIDRPSAARIPERYLRGTELNYEVVAGHDNVFDIEISTR